MATEVQFQQTQEAPAALPEVTWQALVCAFFVSAIVAACYPYIVLKLGIGPNVSVVSAFLGAVLLLGLSRRTRGRNRLMNNIIQTAGTSAAQTAFMCVIAAAVDLVHLNPVVQSRLNGLTGIAPWPMFFWLTCAGGIGVLFTVLFRRHFLNDPKMVFADGIAAAETIIVLDSPGPESRDKLWTLGLCSLASALVNFFHDGIDPVLRLFKNPAVLAAPLSAVGKWFSTFWPYGGAQGYLVGFDASLLTIGTGMLVGVNVALSMAAGTAAVGYFGPKLIDSGIGRDIVLSEISPQYRERVGQIMQPGAAWDALSPSDQAFLKEHGSSRAVAYMHHSYFNTVLLWFMWPATSLMITSAVTAVLLQWRAIGRSFLQLRAQSRQRTGEDVSLSTIVIVSLLLTAGLAFVQNYNFGMSYVQTVVAVLCSLPLILVGIIVLGETNFGPISVMMNGLQAIFGVLWVGSIGHNLIAAGMAGSCNSQSQGTMQDYKTGKLVGSTPRILTWVQLAAVPIGAAAVAVMYPLLVHVYHGVGNAALPAPTGIKIANMAVLLSEGLSAFPRGALLWTAIAGVVGILITLFKHFLHWSWLPSPSGIGLGLLLPGTLTIMIGVGGVFGWLWEKLGRPTYERYAVTVASGFIAGEALLGGLVLPVIMTLQG